VEATQGKKPAAQIQVPEVAPVKGQPGTRNVILGLAIPVLVGIVAFSLSGDDEISVLSISLIIAAGTFGLGAFLGFLFSVPRGAESKDDAGAAGPNTNLVQMSDWFTKVLIGATLVQLSTFVNSIGHFATNTLAPALGNDDVADAYAIALLVGSFIAGFLVAYIYTRLVLQARIAASDQRSFAKQVAAELEPAVSSAAGQAVADSVDPEAMANALKTAAEKITNPKGSPPPPSADLGE
jgi:uncharacterized membrane protein (DUF485 family)